MSKDINIVSVVGARPNFVKLLPIHNRISNLFTHTIIHTGQHYDFELSEIFFREFELPKPDHNLAVGAGSQCYQIGEMIKNLESLFNKIKCDLVLVYGDTNSTFAGAFAANKSNIPIAHIEAGLRSYDRRMPEEINRILTDNLGSYLFAPTLTAVKNLKNEHIYGKIIHSGDLSVEIINESARIASGSTILDSLGIDPQSYILFTMHRSENTKSENSLNSIIASFRKLKEFKIIFPIHPRTKKILQDMNLYDKINECKNVELIRPLGYIDFICLMQNASRIVTDSGGLQKEAYLLSIPCITIRDNTEWVETVYEGWNILVGTDTESIVTQIKEWYPSNKKPKPVFGLGNTSEIITKKIMESFRS